MKALKISKPMGFVVCYYKLDEIARINGVSLYIKVEKYNSIYKSHQ